MCRRSETTSSSKRPSQSVVQVDAQGRRFLIAYPAPVDKLETKPDILNPKSGKLHNFFTKTIFVFLSSTIIFMHKKLGLGSLISQKSISNIIIKQQHHHNVPAFFFISFGVCTIIISKRIYFVSVMAGHPLRNVIIFGIYKGK